MISLSCSGFVLVRCWLFCTRVDFVDLSAIVACIFTQRAFKKKVRDQTHITLIIHIDRAYLYIFKRPDIDDHSAQEPFKVQLAVMCCVPRFAEI